MRPGGPRARHILPTHASGTQNWHYPIRSGRWYVHLLHETLRAKKTIKSTMGQPTAAGTAPDSPIDTALGAAAGENTAPITPEHCDDDSASAAVVDVATTGPGLKLQWVRRRASFEGCKLTLDSLDSARPRRRAMYAARRRRPAAAARGGRRVLIRSPPEPPKPLRS